MLFWLGALMVLIAILGILSVYVVPQWEKVALLRFGRIKDIVETGIHLRIPLVDAIIRVDTRTQTIDLMGQQAITKDNISVIIDAVVFMRIEDPERLILNIQNYQMSVSKYADRHQKHYRHL